MMPAFNFPAELEDLIIDNMHGQRDSLATCGLVCKAWLRSSRHHLFGSVTLRDRTWEGFLQLLDAPHATLIPSIHSLAISTEAASFNRLIPRLLMFTFIRRIERLRLSHLDWASVPAATAACLVKMFANIAEFDLHLVTFDTPLALATLLSCFPHLRRVSLYANFIQAGGTIQNVLQLPAVPPNLAFVRFRWGMSSEDPEYFISWLAARVSHQAIHIHTIEFGRLGATSLPSVANLLNELGPELHDLDLALKNHVSATDIATHLDLSRNTNLQRLTIHISLRRFHTLSALRHAPLGLLSAPSSAITTLTVVLTIDTIAVINSLDWQQLNIALNTFPQFSELRRLHFIVHCFSAMDTVEAGIRARVPEYDARGIVDVSVVFSSRTFTQEV
ncbi:hypothetical protein B0H11DRAFT_2189033 [Mycena galericulata]|nr:hypothetical protein B0H11DRAFT_2189033 [Mycena galericulata]